MDEKMQRSGGPQAGGGVEDVDVVVVGGGAAGLSASVALARSRRSVVVVDAGAPRNAPADGAHNLLGREGVPPLELLAAGRREAEAYGVRVVEGAAVSARREGQRLRVGLADGRAFTGRRLLLATGLRDELPDVPGVADAWGGGVLHCPYCHGWEVRGRRIAVLGTGPNAVHQALLFRQLSDDVTVYDHGLPELGADDLARLDALGVDVVRGGVLRVDTDGREVRAVVTTDGVAHPVEAVVVAPRFVARAELYEQLGGTLTDHPMGRFVAAGPMGRTDVPGVWVAGNVGDLSAMVGASAAAGVGAGAAVNADLVVEDADAAVRRRAGGSARPAG